MLIILKVTTKILLTNLLNEVNDKKGPHDHKTRKEGGEGSH